MVLTKLFHDHTRPNRPRRFRHRLNNTQNIAYTLTTRSLLDGFKGKTKLFYTEHYKVAFLNKTNKQ